MSEGIQITIPDFEDDDYNSSTIPFGRSAGNQFGFGGGFGASTNGSGQDSPTLMTPTADNRSYFSAHARGDSVTSVDSTSSVTARYPNRSQTSFVHSSHSSIAASNSSSFPKKSSFASLRNAFKSGKNTELPPVPSLDYQPNSVLKNAFNRSTSSLNNVSPMPTSAKGIPPAMSPQFGRPATPASAEPRYMRGLPSTRSKSHSYAKSYHSQSGSIFHISDTGSDGHGQFSSSPPPLPRFPNGMVRSETPDFEEDKVVMDPKTPSDFALHAVFIRFASLAEGKIDTFLRQILEQEPLLTLFMGPGVDLAFDGILNSLGKIAQKHAKPVVDSVMRWRKSQVENVGSDIIRFHMAQSPPGAVRTVRTTDVPNLLNERKSLAAIYIMCRALIAVLQSLPKDGLGEALGYSLEKTTFEQFKKPDLKLLLQSANHRTNAELYATMLGHLANVRFVSITDRFLSELGPVAQGQVTKDDMKFENLVRGIKHVQLKVWPPEAFEEGAEFLESFAKSFAHAHGFKLKSAFAETLVQILHPIGKTAQAETNNPMWAKAIEIIYPKAREMMSKPRYWNVAFPLVITSLCVAPESYFRKHWVSCFELSLSKLKEKSLRVPVMNGVIRLMWTYLYRCQDSASTTTSRLDNLLKHFFPPNRLTIFPPQDDGVDPLIYITHFVLSRHFDYGRDLCFELLQESAINSTNLAGGNVANVLASERMTVAIQAIILSFRLIETEASAPSWPSSSDFFSPVPTEDYCLSSEWLPTSVLSRPALQDIFDRLGSVLVIVAKFCSNAVGSFSVLDDQWVYTMSASYEEPHNLVVKRHPEGVRVAYPNLLQPQISTLAACFQTWPRFLHSSISIPDAVDMLLRGVIHIEPILTDIASEAVRRFMADPVQALVVLARYNTFLFNPPRSLQDGIGNKLLVESVQLLSLWEEIVEKWIIDLMQAPRESYIKEEKLIWARCHELEAGVMFLLTHEAIGIHDTGAKIARLLSQLSQKLWPESSTHPDGLMYYISLLCKSADNSYFTGYDEFLDEVDIDRLRQWRESKRTDKLLRVAEGKTDKDRKLWRFIYSTFMHTCADNAGPTLATFRDTVVFAASRYHSTVSHLAGLTGINTRMAVGQSRLPDGFRKVKDNKAVIDQWYLWVKILSSTATLPESSRPALTQLGREHSRAPSDVSFERERLTTTRGLFRYLTPFLDSEYVAFRDAAVLCISSFPSSAYPQLLEDLSLLVGRQVYDDPRGKAGIAAAIEQNMGILAARSPNDTKIGVVFGDRSRRQERLHAAVARIYYLTAHYLPRQRSTGRQAALANVLKFVRNTQAFLGAPENRDSHTFHRLRTYFCGIVEKVFDGLSTLEGSDRFIPGNTHLALYRLCEEWCSLGPQPETLRQRLASMQRAAASDPQSEDGNPVEAFKKESELLSYAAIGALASLCPKAFSPPGVSSGSPLERSTSENLKPLTAAAVLDRLSSILASEHVPSQDRGKRALKALLLANPKESALLAESVKRAVIGADDSEACSSRFFQVIVDMIHDTDAHGFTFAQIVCLGLSNLCHQRIEYRRQAFSMLEAIHRQTSDLLSMSQLEATVESSAFAMYTHAHALVSEFLAGAHPEEALNILSELGAWLPSMPESSSTVILLLLQSLEFWISNIPLMTDDKIGLREHGHSALYHLLCLTLRYAKSHTEQVMALWSKLVEPPHEANGHATVRFLVEQSHKVGSIVFVNCAANIVACICQTAIGRAIYEDLCTVIEPVRVIPTIDHKLAFPTAGDMELWSDLDALFADKQPRLSLGGAQFAWLFLADVALQRCWELRPQLPVLLHSILIHIDHRTPFVRHRAQYMLFQILRSWAPGYDELQDRPPNGTRAAIKKTVKDIEAEAPTKYWREDETSQECEPKMKWLCDRVLYILQPLCPGIREAWGTLALEWSTQCAFRHLAFRSLQTFRALMPRTSIGDLANLLGRLSLTIASPEDGVQSFASEILLTFNALAAHENFNVSLFPQMFWCACAALSTTLEKEFSNALCFVSTLLTRVDLDDPSISELFLNHRPKDWIGSSGLQPALLAGLRSSVTSTKTMKILQTMAVFKDGTLIDPTEGRVRDLYTVSLPWFLHAMSSDKGLIDEDLSRFAENIGELAKQEGRQSIGKIMSSFAKGHFRTRDDFLRQSVSSLREHYGATSWTQIVTLLLGLALNQERWLRIHAMQIVKVLFQQTRSPVERLGSEMLMPLLRLLETDLAPQALDVLEEPMTMSGGLAAKHVLRMSMHARNLMKEDQSAAIVFGAPEDSGWCVAQADTVRETCRANMMGVFDTCSMPSRPSRIDFQPEEVEALVTRKPTEEDLGGLVQNLHDLTTFFQDEPSRPAPVSVPNRKLEARVAAILAKSTAPEAISDVPPTPFVDVFRVSAMEGSDDDSNEFSDSDDEADAFIFDSHSVFHSVPNGSRYH
ncbi:hypothetical protein ARMSODRAFT_1033874 [Armillaria solidipes]|uniref:Cell morphogenesis protein n=1 Tax=Armillaria solidipes TaxID=1076256 RepID=A0A2H3BJ57_9AGAR|nr:hypothetical protein ARMSODRAFT_1033874 [Armillaria solidipes]